MKWGYYYKEKVPPIEDFTDGAHIVVLHKTNYYISNIIKLEDEGWEIRGGKHKARKNEYTGVWYNLDFFNDLIKKSGYKIVTDNVKEYRSTSMKLVGPPRSFTLDGTGTHRMVLLEEQ